MSDPGQKSPAERVLDITVYAPLGLMISVGELFPQLVRKGRSRLAPQIGLARTVGQFAVRQGIRQLRGMPLPVPRWPVGGSTQRGTPSKAGPGPAHTSNGAAGHNPKQAATTGPVPSSAPRPRQAPRPAAPAEGPLDAAHLAIPSYDSLSASQVVQRLAGLSREEVEAVRAYEAATRARRTVLARAEQLLG